VLPGVPYQDTLSENESAGGDDGGVGDDGGIIGGAVVDDEDGGPEDEGGGPCHADKDTTPPATLTSTAAMP
jgi:hypothetical protein